MKKLHPTQEKILKALCLPLFEFELVRDLEIDQPAVSYHVRQLIFKGLVVKGPGLRGRLAITGGSTSSGSTGRVVPFPVQPPTPSPQVEPIRFSAGNINLSGLLEATTAFVSQWNGPSDDALIVSVVLAKCHLEKAVEIVQKRHPVKIEGI